jgi:hypothetical protein
MAARDVSEQRIDYYIERWLLARVDYCSAISRFAAAERSGWNLEEFEQEYQLVFYLMFLAERLQICAEQDPNSEQRAVDTASEIVEVCLPFLRRWPWKSDSLNRVARQKLQLYQQMPLGVSSDFSCWWKDIADA